MTARRLLPALACVLLVAGLSGVLVSQHRALARVEAAQEHHSRVLAMGGPVVWPGTPPYPSPAAAAQATWAIDPLSAKGTCSDQNSGLTSASALCHWSEYRRRVGALPVAASTITLYSSLPGTDPMRPPNALGPVTITGSPGATTLATVVLTSSVTLSRATNTPNSVIATGLPVSWMSSGLINRRARETVGASIGAIFWPAKDLGAKSARISQPMIPASSTPVTLAGTETFVLEALPTVGDLIFDQPTSSFASLTFEGLDFGTIGPSPVVPASSYYGSVNAGATVYFLGCDAGYIDGAYTAVATQFAPQTAFFEGSKTIAGSLLRAFGLNYKAVVYSVLGTISQQSVHETEIIGNASLAIFDLGVFDGPAGLDITDGATVVLDTSQSGSLWGAGSTTQGVRVYAGSGMYWSTSAPTLTGSLGDVNVGGDTQAWSTIATNGYISASGAKALPDTATTVLNSQPLGPAQFFALDVTLSSGTRTVASGKDLTNAALLGCRLKTQATAVGQPLCTFVAGANGNVTCTSYTSGAATATTDASTYTCTFAGAR